MSPMIDFGVHLSHLGLGRWVPSPRRQPQAGALELPILGQREGLWGGRRVRTKNGPKELCLKVTYSEGPEPLCGAQHH